MFKKVMLILSIMAFVAGCSSNAATPAATPSGSSSSVILALTPPWTGADHAEYNILKDADNSALGTSVIDIQPASDATVIDHRLQISGVTQHFNVKVDPQTLKPLVSMEEVTGSSNDFSLTGTYADNKLAVTAKTSQGDKSITIDVPTDAYDNNSLLPILRGMPFSTGYAASFTNIIPANAAQVKVTLTVPGQETVTVPAGTFDTYKVVMEFGGGQQQTAWYEVASPHRLIKYDNGTTQFVLAK
ncbi:MAG TPA: DUF3108 domain-containing protein [Anaerolineae bacterium]|nr:DUF3108 domain-containing protein [Anaerolineae bacterium]